MFFNKKQGIDIHIYYIVILKYVLSAFLKFVLSRPYMSGLVMTDVIPMKWTVMKEYVMIVWSVSKSSRGSRTTKIKLKTLYGSQDRKKTRVTRINARFVFFLLSVFLLKIYKETRVFFNWKFFTLLYFS